MEVHHRFLADHFVALADDKGFRRHRVPHFPILGDERAAAGCLGGNNEAGTITHPHAAVLKVAAGRLADRHP